MEQQSREDREFYCRKYLADRQRARTDLFYLANILLAPRDSRIMVPHAHDPIVDHCQKFQGFDEVMDWKSLKLVASKQRCALWDLDGPRIGGRIIRDRLLLASRGHLKTTIHTEAHCVQWILNYPDIRILLCTAIADQAMRMVGGIKAHFQYNPKIRFLFPEFCPPAKDAASFGSMDEFTVPNRVRKELREPTIMTASVGKVIASTHHDVLKCSDVVTEGNTRTAGQIREAIDFFGYLDPLRERGPSKDGASNVGWKDVEGTIYDFSDYYQLILDTEKNRAPEERQWIITKKSCWVDKAKRITLWPERFPAAELDRIRNSPEVGPRLFASQYELEPVPPGDGLASENEIHFFPRTKVAQLMPRYAVQTTIDLGGMDAKATSADFTVFNTAAFDRDGRLDVLSIQRGRFNLEQIVELFFLIQAMYPQNEKFKVQKDHFARVLEPIMTREMAKRKKWMFIEYIPISTSVSKEHRIRGLQGWFKMGLIRFSDAISCKSELVDEVLRFPKGAHDDILDTLADHFQDQDGKANARVIPAEKEPWERSAPIPVPFDPYRIHQEPDFSSFFSEVTGI